ncbi:MAG TPA: glycosyltransferase family 4 protein [Thermoplasmata archaeon]|nr:glycosyltransferase family 4 protein [Thermoplasmata archaeon]
MVAGVTPSAAKAGGIRSYVLGLSAAMSSLGHDVLIIGSGNENGAPLEGGVRYRSLGLKSDSSSFRFLYALFRRANDLPIADHVLHVQRPDDLVPFMVRGDLEGKFVTVHGLPQPGIKERHGSAVSTAYKFLESIAFRTVDRTIVLDSVTERELRTVHPNAASRIVRGTGGVDLQKFQIRPREEAREVLGLKNLPTVAYVGRLETEKNVELLIRALRHISGAQLLIAGGGSRLSALQTEAAGNPAIHFLGPVPYEVIPFVLNATDVVALPSLRESMPAICLESLACGTPVVATPVGAVPDVIQDGITGFLSDTNEAAFASKLALALGCSGSVRTACRASVLRFGWDRVAQQVLAIYRGVG